MLVGVGGGERMLRGRHWCSPLFALTEWVLTLCPRMELVLYTGMTQVWLSLPLFEMIFVTIRVGPGQTRSLVHSL